MVHQKAQCYFNFGLKTKEHDKDPQSESSILRPRMETNTSWT
jgi:hypothetical protein